MRKAIIICLVALLSIALTYGFADAVVQGACVNCHTMHNSQNNAPMATFGEVAGTTPNDVLLRGTCIGCHGQLTGGSSNIITNIPQVIHAAGTDLAGGNFSQFATDSMVHNVIDLGTGSGEGTLTVPPGDQHTTGITNANLTCAGNTGCHGDRTVSGSYAAVKGAHHANDGVLKFGSVNESGQGDSAALSYRFLKGVKGIEETNWMGVSPGPSVHNEYKGATSMGTSASAVPAGGTISGLCAECHGYYHGAGADETGGSASPWKRHPTDISLPSSGEYASYTQYSIDAPVGRVTLSSYSAGPSTAVTPSGTENDIVLCISCHKAHGSDYPDILRWDYSSISAGTGEVGAIKCFICHTTKDTGG